MVQTPRFIKPFLINNFVTNTQAVHLFESTFLLPRQHDDIKVVSIPVPGSAVSVQIFVNGLSGQTRQTCTGTSGQEPPQGARLRGTTACVVRTTEERSVRLT
jgi:hypothetical protein